MLGIAQSLFGIAQSGSALARAPLASLIAGRS
jgi:hypothetical protein